MPGATPPTTGGSAHDRTTESSYRDKSRGNAGINPSKGHSSSPGGGSGCPLCPTLPKGGGGWQPAERGGTGGKDRVREAEPAGER